MNNDEVNVKVRKAVIVTCFELLATSKSETFAGLWKQTVPV
jgi:hypothetical protein